MIATVRGVTMIMVLCLSPLGLAQELAWRRTGLPSTAVGGGRRIGYKTLTMGDVNGDGVRDLITLVEGGVGAAYGFRGYVWILSGADGSLLLESSAEVVAARSAHFIRSFCSAGDWDRDGVCDFVVGLEDNVWLQHRVEVRSGVDGRTLWWVPSTRPYSVLGDIDVDGDGWKDVVVADYSANGYFGELSVYRSTGSVAYRMLGSPAGSAPGFAIDEGLACVGDIDDDGADDFVVGCRESTGAGVSIVVSGRSGAIRQRCYGELPSDALFYTAARCGDMDGDGYDEFVASSYWAASRQCLRVFSARTGQALYGWCTAFPVAISYQVASGADFDLDSVPDLVVGAWEAVPPGWHGVTYGLSGRDGSQVLRVLPSQPAGGDAGVWLAAVPLPPPGSGGLLVVPASGLPSDGFTVMGTLSAYRGLPRTVNQLGTACAGTLPVAPRAGMQSFGNAGIRLHLSQAPAGAPAVLMLGLSTNQILGVPLPLALDSLGLPGCSLLTSIDAHHLLVAGTSGMDAGYARVDLPQRLPVSGPGWYSISAQWLVLGTGSESPGGVSQALTWRW